MCAQLNDPASHLGQKDDTRGTDRAPYFEHPGPDRPAPVNRGHVPLGVLKPIRINTRAIGKVMRAQLNAVEPGFRRWLVSTINAQREAIKFDEIRNALISGELSQGWLDAWRAEYAELVTDRLAPRYLAVAEQAGATMEAQARRRGFDLPFAASLQRTDAWIATRGAELAVALSDGQTRAVRSTLRVAAQAGLNPRAAERFLRPIIGLDPQAAKWVTNRRIALEAEGLTGKVLERRVQSYAGRLLRARTLRIARTELATAWNQANHDLITEAQQRGDLGMVNAEWYTALDERVCPFCGPLHGTVIPFGEAWPTTNGAAFAPPAHPACRCFLLYLTFEQS